MHVIVLDATNTTYARQQLRYIFQKEKMKDNEIKKHKNQNEKQMPRITKRIAREDKRGEERIPRASCRYIRLARRACQVSSHLSNRWVESHHSSPAQKQKKWPYIRRSPLPVLTRWRVAYHVLFIYDTTNHCSISICIPVVPYTDWKPFSQTSRWALGLS